MAERGYESEGKRVRRNSQESNTVKRLAVFMGLGFLLPCNGAAVLSRAHIDLVVRSTWPGVRIVSRCFMKREVAGNGRADREGGEKPEMEREKSFYALWERTK